MNTIFEFCIINWEPIIAVLGFLLSIINFSYLIKNNWKSIGIKEIFYTKTKLEGKIFYEFNMILMNKSRQPISIVDISFENKGKMCSAKLDRTKIGHSTDPKNVTTTFYSSEFPINLNGLESSKEMILFCLTDEINNEEIDLIITTNRGKIKKMVDFKNKNITIDQYLERILKNG